MGNAEVPAGFTSVAAPVCSHIHGTQKQSPLASNIGTVEEAKDQKGKASKPLRWCADTCLRAAGKKAHFTLSSDERLNQHVNETQH